MQKIYAQRGIAQFLANLHRDDKAGILIRVSDTMCTDFPQPLTVDQVLEQPAHPDDVAVDHFAHLLKCKMAESRVKGRGGWNDNDPGTEGRLVEGFRQHLGRSNPGNYLDLAAYLMMLVVRGAPDDALAKSLEPSTDFTQDLTIETQAKAGDHQAEPLNVSFDGAEGGCVWLSQEAGIDNDENMVCVRTVDAAIQLGNFLFAWANAEQKLKQEQQS